jgi:hypothetical protein
MSGADRRRRSTLLVTVAAVAGLTLVASACGVGFDDEPRAIQEEASTTTVAASPSVGSLRTVLYFVREGALLPVEQELPDRSPTTLLTALAQPPEIDSTGGLSTSIPAGTELLGTSRVGDRLVVDLSSEFGNVVGLSRQQAIGQMVLSVTEQGSIDTVEFTVDGEPLVVSSPSRGDTTEVDECDFAALLASPDDLSAAELPDESLRDLEQRRTALAERCPDVDAGS